MSKLRTSTSIGSLALLSAGVVFLGFYSRTWEVDDQTLIKRYGTDSKFTELDGVKLRYSDQGRGPAIVLVHGAFGNLNYWDKWAEELKGTHRVIRFDVPPEGITEVDPGGYSHDRTATLIGLLADQLGVQKFALSGISRGGTAAVLFAARNPDRVTHLILANTPLLDAKPSSAEIPRSFERLTWMSENLLSGYKPTRYWKQFLSLNFNRSDRLERKWVDLYRDFNNRSGGVADLRILQSYGANRDEKRNIAAAAAIAIPTMILTTNSKSLPPIEQDRVIALFTGVEPELVPVDAGHFPAIELGSETGKIARTFIERTGTSK